MVEIGGRPILWHILKLYSHHGINDFVICCGYKGYVIKEYFANYFLHTSDVTFHMDLNHMEVHRQKAERWKVTLVDTGDSTLTAVQPPGRYGALHLEGDAVADFQEKPDGDNAWINGGFFVLEPAVIDLVDGDQCVWEQAPLKALATQGQLSSFKHRGFWQPMDTLRDRQRLEDLWQQGRAPWKVWS
jgi:glucose-1-phosphate cytidylyltransferase